ncbi:HAD family hydrolase [Martelella radicis]|uniref:HAD superfamily hydrolase (TIGR01509 family) n=1 Tax=Martelella radicis TaxID=1397476 RepID=A0A7W6KH44_9HYPH|nr:HAD family phosphatase [Martelella radicis]MBB4120973.1 HAD superfamily hydrolase (TIGR01509 family) [Martelella radicis]
MNTVIFDFDGVLADSEIIALSELRTSLEEYGIIMDWDALVEQFLGASVRQIIAFVEQRAGRPVDAGFQKDWYKRLFASYRARLKPMPGAAEMLDRLDAAGIDYCIASGGSYKRLGVALECIGFSERFADRAFSADSVEHGKPAPDVFLYAAEKRGASFADCVVLEDSIAGVTAAGRAGMRAIGFVGGGHLEGIRPLHADRLRAVGAKPVLTGLRDFEEAAFGGA